MIFELRNSSLKSKEKLQLRCSVLIDVLRDLGKIYNAEGAKNTQRDYIETIIGAALWYLPTSMELWTGRISRQSLADFHPNSGVLVPRLTEDHEYPRKVSAIELMKFSWEDLDPPAHLLELYLAKYGRFNLVTPTENKVLVKYQRTDVFENPRSAYDRAGIEFVQVTHKELKSIKRRELRTILECVERSSDAPPIS